MCQCEYESLDRPCKLCSKRGFVCGESEKDLGPKSATTSKGGIPEGMTTTFIHRLLRRETRRIPQVPSAANHRCRSNYPRTVHPPTLNFPRPPDPAAFLTRAKTTTMPQNRPKPPRPHLLTTNSCHSFDKSLTILFLSAQVTP
jgi:hypothetical protein